MSPRYRLLAADLDGTLISLDLHLDPRDVEAVARAQAAGINVVAVTGRPFPGALPWVRKLGITQPIVCYQGAQIREQNGGMFLLGRIFAFVIWLFVGAIFSTLGGLLGSAIFKKNLPPGTIDVPTTT